MSSRPDCRKEKELRPITIERNISAHAEGSAIIKAGRTEVLCMATVESRVPPFLKDSGKGWVTAEYAMLPRATTERTQRERLGAGGRTMEIQRLIGRSLRAVTELALLGDHTITVDCDVIQADGGTRCASITGACVAMYDAMRWMVEKERIASLPVKDLVAGISVGIRGGSPILDLNYEEDSSAEVDMNIVMTGAGLFVEIQGTAEETPFAQESMDSMVRLARTGLEDIFHIQKAALGLG